MDGQTLKHLGNTRHEHLPVLQDLISAETLLGYGEEYWHGREKEVEFLEVIREAALETLASMAERTVALHRESVAQTVSRRNYGLR